MNLRYRNASDRTDSVNSYRESFFSLFLRALRLSRDARMDEVKLRPARTVPLQPAACTSRKMAICQTWFSNGVGKTDNAMQTCFHYDESL